MKRVPQLTCPTCKELHDYSLENPWRPFCSQRCKNIDLGQWASEGYKIPQNGPTESPEDEEF